MGETPQNLPEALRLQALRLFLPLQILFHLAQWILAFHRPDRTPLNTHRRKTGFKNHLSRLIHALVRPVAAPPQARGDRRPALNVLLSGGAA